MFQWKAEEPKLDREHETAAVKGEVSKPTDGGKGREAMDEAGRK